ncbi:MULTISPECIES: hypothetical protein [Metabacillus]|uniref:Uncharacterized protein n=2 Tax=Metabacillus TaxID=2675233 RepID=A0A179T495_9BACI|nr:MULTISPECIES: hypothetical protein [Metabacillus]OAS88996.1 hypothetical protein A6K24_00040 [Metabacillus litoralis]QNF28498.1 hypothetical protein HUW50_14030 [Metabacillus sp. KUDC1714]
MGYILPIQQYTYIQYANRNVPVQNHYSHTLRPTAVQSDMKKQRFEDILDYKMRSMKTNKNSESFIVKGKYIDRYA